MDLLVAYDVSTETRAGRRHLRRVAQVCENYGQRVQQSVFECQVNQSQYEMLIEALLAEIDEGEDSLRIYRLIQPREKAVRCWGYDPAINFKGPLVF